MNIPSSPAQPSITALIRRYGVRPRKGRGQHFLINESIARRIVDAGAVTPETTVLEIGPGVGALTRHLVERAGQVIAVEIDARLMEILRAEYAGHPNLRLIHQDILEFDIAGESHFTGTDRLTVIANLPYNITGPAFDRFIRFRACVARAVIMVQEEVGQRITAAPGTRAYGALSVILGYWFCARLLFRVGPGNFLPHPAVQSVVLELTPYDKPPVQVKDVAALMALIRAGFAQRRKMMHHAVERLYPGASALAGHRTGIDLTRRGETLSLEEFAALSDALSADDRYVTNKP